jgi:alkanesulfonate monooxygenase SsuD/methylene tetrahydromethanopterin reductase-like flavin-dependent oxidoreductase (luciferase family)
MPHPTLILAAALALSACGTSPRMDRQFGNSVRLAKAQQTLNPDARLNRAPVNGLDPQAARAAYDSYQRSYAQPDTQSGGSVIGGVGVGNR